jgi:hypothetical protein
MQYSGKEKRKYIRANFPCKIIIFPPGDYTIATHTENICAGGIKVIIEEKLPVSREVGLEVCLKDKTINCKGKITWVVTRGSPYRKGIFYFDTGIEFIDINDEDRNIIDNIVAAIVSQEK